jgi:hypothetical protein
VVLAGRYHHQSGSYRSVYSTVVVAGVSWTTSVSCGVPSVSSVLVASSTTFSPRCTSASTVCPSTTGTLSRAVYREDQSDLVAERDPDGQSGASSSAGDAPSTVSALARSTVTRTS